MGLQWLFSLQHLLKLLRKGASTRNYRRSGARRCRRWRPAAGSARGSGQLLTGVFSQPLGNQERDVATKVTQFIAEIMSQGLN